MIASAFARIQRYRGNNIYPARFAAHKPPGENNSPCSLFPRAFCFTPGTLALLPLCMTHYLLTREVNPSLDMSLVQISESSLGILPMLLLELSLSSYCDEDTPHTSASLLSLLYDDVSKRTTAYYTSRYSL